ncbi:MAG: carbohydrate ABC transporter permease [Bacillota bacterium]|jgi:putative aldouronate transport system permease protein
MAEIAEYNRKKLYHLLIAATLITFGIITFVPFYYVAMTSFSDPDLIREGVLLLTPKQPTLDAYRMILTNIRFLNCFKVTVLRTVFGTFLGLALQCSLAYALSRRYLPGRKFFMKMIIFAMLFNGGIIPTYLVVKATGLVNTFWALIIPNAISTWNVILMRTFFENIPVSLEEAAKIDGANDLFVFTRIVLPLSKPVLATIGLFCAVKHWNSFMDAVIYLSSYQFQVLQVFLRDMIVQMEALNLLGDQVAISDFNVNSLSLRSAAIFTATIPIILVYPFIQKYFTKGLMVGAIKG